MTRAFNLEVFNQTINGHGTTAPIHYTSMDFAATLGSADSLLAHIIVEGLTAASKTLTVQYQSSNTGKTNEFVNSSAAATITPTTTDGTEIPYSKYYSITAASDLGAYGRFAINYNDASIISVRIVVCGRTN